MKLTFRIKQMNGVLYSNGGAPRGFNLGQESRPGAPEVAKGEYEVEYEPAKSERLHSWADRGCWPPVQRTS